MKSQKQYGLNGVVGRMRINLPTEQRESYRLEAQPSRAGLEPASRAIRFTGGGDCIKKKWLLDFENQWPLLLCLY